jgi:hypothetical protein
MAPTTAAQVPNRAGPLVSLFGAVAILVGSFLPWATLDLVLSINGIETTPDGQTSLVLGLVLALTAVVELASGTDTRLITGLCSLGAIILGLVEIGLATGAVSGSEVLSSASVGVAVYAILVGGGAALVGALLHRS